MVLGSESCGASVLRCLAPLTLAGMRDNKQKVKISTIFSSLSHELHNFGLGKPTAHRLWCAFVAPVEICVFVFMGASI